MHLRSREKCNEIREMRQRRSVNEMERGKKEKKRESEGKKKHKHHGGEGVLLLLSLWVPWDGLTHR